MAARRLTRDKSPATSSYRAICIASMAAGAIWLVSSVAEFVGRDATGPDPAAVRTTIDLILSERRDALRSQLSALAIAATPADAGEADLRAHWTRILKSSFAAEAGAGGALVLDSAGVLVGGIVDGEPANATHLRAMLPLLQGAIRESGGQVADARALPRGERVAAATSGILSDGALLVATSAVAIDHRRDGAAPVIVGWRMIDQQQLAKLGATIGVQRLHFVTGLPVGDSPALPIVGPRGLPVGHLAWTRQEPGTTGPQLLMLLLQLTAGAGLVVFGFTGVRGGMPSKAGAAAADRDSASETPAEDGATRLRNLLRSHFVDVETNGIGVALYLVEAEGLESLAAERPRLLRHLVDTVSPLVRESDIVVDLGCSRLAIVQPAVRSAAGTRALGRRIIESLTASAPDGIPAGSVSTSVGIALAPQDGATPEKLIENAGRALRRAQESGGYRVRFHDTGLDTHQQERKAFEEDLCAGIMQGQLSLAFQPLVLADGDTTTAVEALVRWRHPERGPVPPAEFIPLAEERGLIDLLGEWVLRKACETGRRWPGITVAVNVSPIQFRRPGFVDRVLRIVEETGFDPWRLELELTEGVVVDNEDAAEKAMMDLRAAGIRLALDDFGTGYSSLIYLRRFAFDKIKIDKSFLDSMETTGESAILVHSVIHLGRALGLTVTAEGVETPEQHRFLQAAGCHQLQGYLFSKPVTASEIDARLGIISPLAVRAA